MTMRARWHSERGAVIIHVAVAIVGLLAFSALTIDYGVMWASRRQAQNAADAAAMAGAISLAFNDPEDFNRARSAAEAAGESNQVWGVAPQIDPAVDIIIGACPSGITNASDICVRANVFRNNQSNPLPTFFARLLGVQEQGVRATATARVLMSNGVTCLRPWAIPDKWYDALDTTPPVEATPTWTWDDKYERYVGNGSNAGTLLPDPRDCYHAALEASTGPYLNNCPGGVPPTSFDATADRGTLVELKVGNPTETVNAGWFFPIDLPRAGEPSTGGNRYRENIHTCNSLAVSLGDTVASEPGNMIGPTKQGMDELIAKDPNARWNGTDVVDGWYGTNNSPRIVPIPVFNVEAYMNAPKNQGKFDLQITNILGFFVLPMQGNTVRGILMPYRGDLDPDAPTVDPANAFLYQVVLVR